jgi:hypothetical protein
MFDIIQSLWVGGELSQVEQMCIRSFLYHGHRFHLYTYGEVKGVPNGTVVKSADDLVRMSEIKRFQNLANFSDFFRYTMLRANGNWWCDLDMFCLKPFAFPEPYVFASQLCDWGDEHPQKITCCAVKVPAGCELMERCLDRIEKTDLKTNSWPAIGPENLEESAISLGLQSYMKPKNVFCPLDHFYAPPNIFFPESGSTKFGPETYGVHLWNEEMRRFNLDKNAAYPGSLFARLMDNGQ